MRVSLGSLPLVIEASQIENRRLVSRSDGSWLLIGCFPSTTIQTCKYSDRQSSIQVHRPLRQHCPAAFITSLHGGNLAPLTFETNPPEVLDGTDNGPNGVREYGPFGHKELLEAMTVCHGLWSCGILTDIRISHNSVVSKTYQYYV